MVFSKMGILLVVWATICAEMAVADSFLPLGDLPGSSVSSRAEGVSSDGSVIVGVSASSFSSQEAFVWTSAGGMVGLGGLSNLSRASWALGVSADGTRVVGYSTSDNGQEAFLWDALGGLTGLGDLPGGPVQSAALDISADGSTIVGTCLTNVACGSFGCMIDDDVCIWDGLGGISGLGLPGGGGNGGRAVDANGSSIVGTRGLQGFSWTSTAGVSQINSSIPGVTFSLPNDVSSDGRYVVGRANTPSGGQAFLFDRSSGSQSLLGDLPGGAVNSFAAAVSSDASVVVGGSTTSAGDTAFIWDSTNGMRSLEGVLIASGVDITGWRLTAATDVSPDGSVIVGVGINPAGRTEAFRAVVPEPSVSLALAPLVLLLGVLSRGRRFSEHRDCCQTRATDGAPSES